VRIAAWFVVLLALIITALSAFLIVELRTDLVGAIDDALRPAAGQIRQDISIDGVGEFGDSARSVLKGERPAAQLVTPDGVILASFGDPIAQRPMGSRADLAAALRGRHPVGTRTLGPGHDDFRVTSVGVVSHGRRYVIVAAQSSESVDRSVGRLVRLLVLGGSAALLVSAVAGWWLARRSLRPMQLITNTAEAIGVERLSDRVPPGRSHDEVAHLANTINTMLDRIQHGVLAQQRLVADTSHELRTPLAAMRSELDVSLRADDLSPAAREVLLSAREEVDGLSRTVDDLLTLAAGDDSPIAASTATTDLARLARTAADTLATVARQHGVTVQHDGSPVTVSADPVRLGHAIRNVVENAIAFSPRGGTVGITTSVHSEFGRLAIGDDGPGIPVELRERIFDRFFRVDPSRSRATGGSGLGLAITRQIIEAHGGRIRVESAGRGTVFVIDLPGGAAATPPDPDPHRDTQTRAPCSPPRTHPRGGRDLPSAGTES
jgi:heavy metal sensor kinase